MGRLLKLKTESIKPSQDYLKPETVNFILECYDKGEVTSLPPAPLVRRHPGKPDVFVAIDGHNLLAVNKFLGIESEVYLAEAADDFLPNPNNLASITQRNHDLSDKYESCIQQADQLNSSFEELIKKFISLFKRLKKI